AARVCVRAQEAESPEPAAQDVVDRARAAVVANAGVIVGTDDREERTCELPDLGLVGAEPQAARPAPAAGAPHRVDRRDAVIRELDGEPVPIERAVREVPGRRCAPAADAVRRPECGLHLLCRLAEADAAEGAARDERARVR